MCILLLHHKCHLSSANTNGQRSITMISNCELSCHWVGYPKVHNMGLYISSPWIQGRDSRMWPVSGLQGYKEKDRITWPLSGLQGLYTPKRRFAWSSRQDRPNQVTMAPKRELWLRCSVCVWSKIALCMAGWLNSRIGAAQWLQWTCTHFKNPVQLLASCCSLWLVADNRRLWTFDSFDCYQIGKGLKMDHKSMLKSHLSTHVFCMRWMQQTKQWVQLLQLATTLKINNKNNGRKKIGA